MTTAAGYRLLVKRFGRGPVADAVLARWMSDPDGDQAWFRLARDINTGKITYNRKPR